MAHGDRLNVAGSTTSSRSYQFGSGKRPYAKYYGLDPAITGVGVGATIYCGDATAIRVSVGALANATNTVGLSAGSGVSEVAPDFEVAIGLDIATPSIVWLTVDVPEFLVVERVLSDGAALEVIVDVYHGPSQR